MASDLAHASRSAAVDGISFEVSVRPRLPEGGNRGYNEAWVYFLELGVIEPQFFHELRGMVLHKNVGILEQFLEDFLSGCRFYVKCNAELVGIQVEEEPAPFNVGDVVRERAVLS